jgi:hypothetical protein
LSGIELLALPEVTDFPFTFTVAVDSATVGVTLMELAAFGTLAV